MAVSKAEIEKEISRPETEVSIIKLVDSLLLYAFQLRSSDVHLDPAEHALDVRFRIDGVMQNVFSFPKAIHSEVISRIKVLSGMRTDEHQMAQDGRIKFSAGSGKDKIAFDIRVSIVPTYHGENGVLRLLIQRGTDFTVDGLKLTERDRRVLTSAIARPYGMVLVTGPTGSGKTTTLYTLLRTLNQPDVSIITIEDPIEYSLNGTNQIQVNNQTGLTFANGLRAILRQDPNIIMVGEIRDEETAAIAVNAALTGHLLLSTLHTNNAATTLPRLLDMKIEPFLIASTVNVAIGQRLVRVICEHCKEAKKLTQVEAESLKKSFPQGTDIKPGKTFYYGKGCDECSKTGFYSRIGIYEIIEITSKIRDAIVTRKSADVIRDIAVSEGMTTMIQDGFIKAENGTTTIQEVLRVMHE
jgi:type II secretory ATPase GspE/PulE/Tfp pilus assembly ATPase PilB-like protein